MPEKSLQHRSLFRHIRGFVRLFWFLLAVLFFGYLFNTLVQVGYITCRKLDPERRRFSHSLALPSPLSISSVLALSRHEVEYHGEVRRTVKLFRYPLEMPLDFLSPWLQIFGHVVSGPFRSELGGVYVEMLLKRELPPFLPVEGYQVRVTFDGMPMICYNCFRRGHYRVPMS